MTKEFLIRNRAFCYSYLTDAREKRENTVLVENQEERLARTPLQSIMKYGFNES